jgi:Zn-dependent peptidase ImmA (M78 family)
VEHVRDWLERYLAIEDLLGVRLSFSQPDIDRRISAVAEAERVAMAVRDAWGLGRDAIDDLTEILEQQGIKVGVVEGHNDFDALTLWVDGDVPVIVVKQGVPGDRQRLSVAHELGHILLEMPEEWGNKEEEAAAYRFAGALLMPEADVRQKLGDHRDKVDPYELYLLKHAYGLSMQAIVRRAKDLGVFSDGLYRLVCQEFGKRGWRKVEPWDQVESEQPTRMKRLVLRALAEEIITRSRAAELLNRPVTDSWEASHQHHYDIPELVHP